MDVIDKAKMKAAENVLQDLENITNHQNIPNDTRQLKIEGYVETLKILSYEITAREHNQDFSKEERERFRNYRKRIERGIRKMEEEYLDIGHEISIKRKQ